MTSGNERAAMFDRTLPGPSWRNVATEWSAAIRQGRRPPPLCGTAPLPVGDGHAVLVLPAFLCPDRFTLGFRRALDGLGYRTLGWGCGVNFGPTAAALQGVDKALDRATSLTGTPATLVGHSLGGVMARSLALRHPDRVRGVITVCSPFRLPVASPLEPVYRALSRWHSPDVAALSAQLAEVPPMPTLAIYTRSDGIVTWTSCIDPVSDGPVPHRNLEIAGRHSTMLGNPDAFAAIAMQLAQWRG